MPTVRTRSTSSKAAKPVSRRRDRAVDNDDVEEEDDEDVDVTERRPARRATKRTSAKSRVVTRSRKDEDEDEDDVDDEDEEDLDEDEDDDEEEESRPRARKAAAKKRPAARTKTRRSAADEDEDDEDEDDEEEKPRRTRSKGRTRGGPPPGVHVGNEGAEETTKAGGGGANRVTLSKEPQLMKALENEPFVSFLQHWVPQGGGAGDRPVTCPGEDCPLCELGDRTSKTYLYNMLLFPSSGPPTVKILQLGVKAFKQFRDTATDRKGNLHYDKDFWAVARTGKGNESSTNFRPVKLRDIEDDWDEILDFVDLDEIDEVIAEAVAESLFDYSIVQIESTKKMREMAKYLAED